MTQIEWAVDLIAQGAVASAVQALADGDRRRREAVVATLDLALALDAGDREMVAAWLAEKGRPA